MDAVVAGTVPAGGEASENSHASAASRRFVRGSSLLLAGRFISVLLNFAVQVLAVRYLSKGHYGAFAYGIGVATLGSSILLLGLAKGIPRLVPIYSERNEQDKAFGAIVLSVATICVLGLGLVLGLFVLQDQVGSGANLDRETLSLLLVLIAIAPIDALDKLLQQVVAVYCSARAIFFRRQVVGPGLKLAAVLFVMAVTGDVYMLAYGYVLGSLIGVSLYLATLLRTWSRQGLLQYLRPGKYRLPFRELFGFSIPLLTTDLSVALRGALVVILLEYFRDASSVGEYRAVVSVAHLNTVVFEAFGFLFVPLASRMYARNDRQGIGDLYWATSLWIAVLTFPLFAATCVLSPTITVLLFGDRYAGAAVLLSVLAAGHYFNAALGFNASTLRVHGKVRYIVAADVLTVVLCVALGVVLVGRYGALGGALTASLALILNNLFVHAGLWMGRTGVPLFPWKIARVYLLITLATLGLAAGDRILLLPAWMTAVLAGAVGVAVLRVSRGVLNPGANFPEMLRVPVLRRLLA
ncbi:MAG TPA: oligosaccharide flippase family protein [Vicinamibacterales bacterium]|nr:oligosaccharide flippase family protein [Acidobacteriota bacterium]HOC19413.1 oligosaccharide flippase family protein [Vicinamibacterales bacterium]